MISLDRDDNDPTLEELAQETGGLSFAIYYHSPSNALNDAFLAMAENGLRMLSRIFSKTSFLRAKKLNFDLV